MSQQLKGYRFGGGGVLAIEKFFFFFTLWKIQLFSSFFFMPGNWSCDFNIELSTDYVRYRANDTNNTIVPYLW